MDRPMPSMRLRRLEDDTRPNIQVVTVITDGNVGDTARKKSLVLNILLMVKEVKGLGGWPGHWP